jgi:predicted nucleic acid-binding protein
MIGWLLDTHIVGALASPAGAPSVRAWAAAQEEERLFLSVLVLAEIEQGIERLAPGDPDRSRHAGTLHAIEARFAGRILPLGDAVVRRWGRIAGRVKRETGHPPPVIDTLLAATAIEHDLYLATRNTKDVSHAGAALFNPWLDDPARFPLT